MQIMFHPVLVVIVLATGCSSIVARSGTRLWEISSQNEAQYLFGPPIETSRNESTVVEDYTTRRKLADDLSATAYVTDFGMSFGFHEPLNLSREIFSSAIKRIRGQRVTFTYNEAGDVIACGLPEEGKKWNPQSRGDD